MTSTFASWQAPFPQASAPNRDRLNLSPDTAVDSDSSGSEEAKVITHVPGEPAVSLHTDNIGIFLSNRLGTPLLDELYGELWLVARKSSRSVDPLHTQKVKGRNIVPSEDPRLHLVWNRDKIYIKPVPVFLLNYDFWGAYLQSPTGNPTSDNPQQSFQPGSVDFDRSIAAGFLRSYALLVQSRLDFALAKEAHLIPDDVENWLQWSTFINHFRHLADEHVARRYHYGQLRLSRLNWVVRIFRPANATSMWFYEIPYWSITDFIARATIPLLFLFASTSLVLSSMQVVLSVPVDDPWLSRLGESGLRRINRAFWVFSVIVVLGWIVACALILGIPLIFLTWQVQWGYRRKRLDRAGVSDLVN